MLYVARWLYDCRERIPRIYPWGECQHDPPRYVYTIIDPLVYINGKRWMMVRCADGETDYVYRDTAVFFGLYYVKSK